jgi:hypothetical protein
MIREVQLSDVDDVSKITQTLGWGSTTLSGWQRMWRDNPALRDFEGKRARGWVLEENGQVVGYLCNLAASYRLGSRTLRAAIASSLFVLEEFRGLSLQLLLAFANQKDVDLLLNTTAAPHVSKICEFLRFERVPQPNYNISLYWILGSQEFVLAGLKKKRIPQPFAQLGSIVLSGPAALYSKLRHSLGAAAPAGDTLRVVTVDAVDGKFDDLWERSSRGGRLLAFRDSATLRWHLAASRHEGWPILVTASCDNRLLGYVALVRQDAAHLGLTRARVADLFVETEDRPLVAALLASAIREAGRRGIGMVEFVGFPEPIRAAAADLRPLTLSAEAWPFLYRASDPDLRHALARPEAWYASLFDGDGSIAG